MKNLNQLMLRVPQFPYNAKIEDVWEDLIESISYSSPYFHSRVKHLTPETFEQAPAKIQKTIIKYFNRAKYRCTPLGTFSAFGIVDVKDTYESNLVIGRHRTFHSFSDWPQINELSYDFSTLIIKNSKLLANSTFYRLDNTIRYVRRKEASFELAEVIANDMMIAVLEQCKQSKKISDLSATMAGQISTVELYALLESMIVGNLLFTELDPNTIGNDYFTRIGLPFSGIGNPYIITELRVEKKTVSRKPFRHLPELMTLLTKLLPKDTNSIHITEFITQYIRRFDRQHISVMEALDPEMGVGYGNFYNEQQYNSIMPKLLSNVGTEKKNIVKDPLEEFLKSGLEWKVGSTLDLETLQFSTNKNEEVNHLPNTLSVIGSLIDDQFILERIGGHTANQLAGRFSICGNDASNYAKSIAQIEEDANPNIIFFDINYNAELQVDNINRRERLYSQELQLLNFSELKEPLTLSDIYISISGNAIILRSKRLGKRLVPRMASAYNYRRSNLPVFRFLYDLAFYGVWPDLTFDITNLLPNMRYYPKVVFKNIILSLPRIVITKKEFEGLSESKKYSKLTSLLQKYKIGTLVKIVKGEENTIYNLKDDFEKALFVEMMYREEKIIVEKFYLPENSLVEDNTHGKYINQLVLPMYHQREIYPASASIIDDITEKERNFMPLHEWLYMELYCHPLRSDEILLGPIQNVISEFEKHILQWFFIRYNEESNHLRLRIKADTQYLSAITDSINIAMKPYLESGLLKDIRIRMYQRELERYDVVGIADVEKHFHLDTEIVMGLLKRLSDDMKKYLHCVRIMQAVYESGVIRAKRFTEWIAFIRAVLEQEHHLESEQFKILNKYVKERLWTSNETVAESEYTFIRSFITLLSRCPDQRRAPLLTDLMHMHINRLFQEHQRTQEMVFYNIMKAELHRMRHQTSITSRTDVSTE